ncbi:DNA-3-methyladenine glycosylase 2 family protein [Sulfitobacter sp. F26169L]|uniref:DNA-3-methyladenine glycosylase family protein n=1 Tax=Sulfitobacter sp. F26169L TaxID=2996015 RepID=UPI002260AEBF|nr:DNA-3-methyladenine glycosylase 2 family protein [Sulfitobacter sp. F26169L]MCX7566115.1 DNA-3-methyladenine glycosylase 2 family protein [Sulfitobacter sp. F26169L]
MTQHIRTDADVAQGAAWLAQAEPRFAAALAQTGPLPLRLSPDGFGALFNKIVSQQVSVASARAIWGRVVAAGLDTPDAVRRASQEDLKSVGLSRPKMKYARALADAAIDYDRLRDASDAQVIEILTAVSGIGVWTAQVYAMFNLGRADVFAPGDLALQESARMLFDLPQRPTPKQLEAMALHWSPWRAVAARLLFTYYRIAKDREGIT